MHAPAARSIRHRNAVLSEPLQDLLDVLHKRPVQRGLAPKPRPRLLLPLDLLVPQLFVAGPARNLFRRRVRVHVPPLVVPLLYHVLRPLLMLAAECPKCLRKQRPNVGVPRRDIHPKCCLHHNPASVQHRVQPLRIPNLVAALGKVQKAPSSRGNLPRPNRS